MFPVKDLPFQTTLARQIAKQHLDNFNNVFWVGERSFQTTRRGFSSIKMPVPGPGVHGFFPDEGSWQSAVDEFRTWNRQHVLISAASLLEVYVQSAGTAALSAQPDLIDRSLAGHPGIEYIKHPERTPKYLKDLIKSRVDGYTVGLWSERLLRLSLVFGALPKELLDMSANLQSLQDRRNRIAHSYGIGGELRKTPWEPLQAISVSPKQIVEAIKCVSLTIRILDNEVFGPRIGGYEILHEFDVWTQKQKNLSHLKVSGSLATDFRTHIGNAFGRTPGADYIKQMIAYYNKI